MMPIYIHRAVGKQHLDLTNVPPEGALTDTDSVSAALSYLHQFGGLNELIQLRH